MTKKEFIESMLEAYASMPRGDLQACVEAYALDNGLDSDELLLDIDEAYGEWPKRAPVIGYYFNPNTGEHGKRAVKDELQEYYKLLDCDTIEAPSFKIDGRWYTVVCDGEGRLKEGNKPSGIYRSKQYIAFVGPIFLVSGSGTPNFASLTEQELSEVAASVKKALFVDSEGEPFASDVIVFD